MGAIPLQQPAHVLDFPIPKTQGIFERGDKTFLTTPVSLIKPSSSEIEEYAFSKAVKQNAPNENIVWLKGSYVEADRANANGAEWTARELSIKSLTPMLMPVTVMHDPRTAVGTIADTKLLTPEKDGVDRTRIDTVLALWGHRFPEAVREAEVNASDGTLMQSMECFSPWYECSDCGKVFHKLPQGAERAQWCEHLVAADHPDDTMRAAAGSQTSNASRILGDVCFTGTGLIFGSRGARGAYSEAHLESWEDEVASMHQAAHVYTASSSSHTTRSDRSMSLVQIEQSELDLLRKERDDARSESAQAKTEAAEVKAEADRKVEEAEAKVTKADEEKAAAIAEKANLEEKANQATLKDTRWSALGAGFTAKLGATTRSNLESQAKTLTDEQWDARLTEVEELTAVKRDARAPEGGSGGEPKDAAAELAARQADTAPSFSLEEVASAGSSLGGSGNPATPTIVSRDEQTAVVGQLAGLFK